MGRTKIIREETPIEQPKRRSKPAMTDEGRENQLIALAYDLVEKRLRNGTATSQETTHFLRLGSTMAKREKDVLDMKREKMQAEIEQIHGQERMERMFAEAIEAMRSYNTYEDDDE